MSVSVTYNPAALSARTGQGSALGNREDLSDVVHMIEAKDTPFYSLAGKTKATATFHEWLVDKLETPVATAINEGADVTSFDDAHRKVARIGNRTEQTRTTWRVSLEQQLVNSAGKQDKVRAIQKKLAEHKRHVELKLLADRDLAVEDGTTANTMRGFGTWIASTAPSGVAADYATPAASLLAAAPTEITLNDVLGSIFSISGQPEMVTLMAGITLRKRISEFTRTDNNASETVYNSVENTNSKRVTLSVTIFDSDFGILNVINGNPQCMPAATRGYIFQPKQVKIATLLATGSHELEDQGGGPRGYINSIETLEVSDPRGFGKIAY